MEKIGRKITDISCSNIFADMSPKARDIKGRITKLDYIKLKISCMGKENISKRKGSQLYGKNIFANDTSDKGLISKVYKEFTKLHTKKTYNLIKKWAKDLTDTSSRKTNGGPRDI